MQYTDTYIGTKEDMSQDPFNVFLGLPPYCCILAPMPSHTTGKSKKTTNNNNNKPPTPCLCNDRPFVDEDLDYLLPYYYCGCVRYLFLGLVVVIAAGLALGNNNKSNNNKYYYYNIVRTEQTGSLPAGTQLHGSHDDASHQASTKSTGGWCFLGILLLVVFVVLHHSDTSRGSPHGTRRRICICSCRWCCRGIRIRHYYCYYYCSN